MLSEEKPIITHINNEGIFQCPLSIHRFHQPADTFVHRNNRLTIPFVVFLEIEIHVIGKFDTMARVTLVLHPAGHIPKGLWLVRPRSRRLERLLLVFERMAIGRKEVGVYCLM